MLVPIWNVFTEQLQPLGPGHHLKVSLEPQVHLRALDHRAGRRVVAHLLQRHRRADHGAGELDAAFPVLAGNAHLVVRSKPAAVAPAGHLRAQLYGEGLVCAQELKHRAPEAFGKQRFGHRR